MASPSLRYIHLAKTIFPMLAGVLLDMPVSQSISNKFKTQPQFIVDIFITQDTHVCWYDIMIIRLISWSCPFCHRSGNCGTEDRVPVNLL